MEIIKEEVEKYITKLKKDEKSQIESVKLLINKFGLSLADADFYLLNSKAWEAHREKTVGLRNLFSNELEGDATED